MPQITALSTDPKELVSAETKILHDNKVRAHSEDLALCRFYDVSTLEEEGELGTPTILGPMRRIIALLPNILQDGYLWRSHVF